MTYLKLFFSLAITAMLNGFVSAYADEPVETFSEMDANADGLVSEAEFVSFTTANGTYTPTEAEETFARMAGDDAVLTLSELESALSKRDVSSDTRGS